MKWLFWLVLLVPPPRFVLSEDVEVAMGAAMFGAEALTVLFAVWLIGVPILGVLMLLTRGRLLVIEQPPPTA